MKTALELLEGEAFVPSKEVHWLLEMVARRAREEAYEMASNAMFDAGVKLEIIDAIRALPTEPTT